MGVASLAFSPDSMTLASGAENQWIFHWDVESRKIIGWTPGQYGRVVTVAFSPDGRTLASAGIYDSFSIKVWDMNDLGKRQPGPGDIPSLSCLWQEAFPGSNAACLAFSPDGRTLVSGGNLDGKIRFWGVAGDKQTPK